MSIKELLYNWAKEAINEFNSVSKATTTQYYLQSPLDQITEPIDTLILGINPGSTEPGVTEMKSPEEFLKGNIDWDNRFKDGYVSSNWAKYFGNGHFMLCGDQERRNGSLDEDTKTVWSNLTPFATTKASKLSKDHLEKGIPVGVQMIKILKPKRIILFTTDGFNRLEQYAKVERLPIVKDLTTNRVIEIGTIEGIPTIQLPHPSGNWGFPKFFLPMIVQLHRLHAVDETNGILEDAANKIKYQLKRVDVI